LRRPVNIILVSMMLLSSVNGQETVYGPGYGTMLMSNPALSGAEGSGVMRLSYMNFLPGNHYNLHSFYASYDTYVPVLHGGAGAWISNDYLGGIINDLRGGISYAYFLKAGRDLYINAGLSAGVFRRGFSFANAVLPDMIDPFGGPVLQPGELLAAESRTVLDIGAGLLIMYREFFAGLALNHLSQPDISAGSATEYLGRKLTFHAATSIGLGGSGNLALRPAGYAEIQADRFMAALGSSLESKMLSVNTMLLRYEPGYTAVQAGFAVQTGAMGIFYNYRFGISSQNGILPLSLLHQTGISFTLNKTDKSKALNTISLPWL
jgi:type IX secretion system PorP/SprF family membrane protein